MALVLILKVQNASTNASNENDSSEIAFAPPITLTPSVETNSIIKIGTTKRKPKSTGKKELTTKPQIKRRKISKTILTTSPNDTTDKVIFVEETERMITAAQNIVFTEWVIFQEKLTNESMSSKALFIRSFSTMICDLLVFSILQNIYQ